MLKQFAVSAFLAAWAIFPASAATPDPLVEQVQTLLAALGYKVGTPDGIAGKRTETAIEEAMASYGQTYDGAISQNEADFLARVAPVTVSADFGTMVSELSYVDSADVNGDGRLDFIVTGMSDPSAQLGIPCCEVPADRVGEVVASLPVLVLSTATGYTAQQLPAEAAGRRTWAGKFFTGRNGGLYFVLGKNGEMGLPQDNRGEVSQLYRVDSSASGVSFTKLADYEGPGITASVSVMDSDLDKRPEIFLNNYGPIGRVAEANTSTIRELTDEEALRPTSLNAQLMEQIAANRVVLTDFDGNGDPDVLVATEVWKSLDGKNLESERGGSYYLRNPFGGSGGAGSRTYLDPPHHGDDHASFTLLPVVLDGRTFIFEGAMKFLGHQAGGYVDYALDVYEFSKANIKGVTLVTKDVLPKAPAERDQATQADAIAADVDFDGQPEVYLTQYNQKPQYLDWNGTQFVLKDFPTTNSLRPEFAAKLALLPELELKCTRAVTFIQSMEGRKQTGTDILISECIPLAP